jgi:hypothetical protein
MAYSLMANLPPINGLYVSFLLILQYVFFGTSKHISVGKNKFFNIYSKNKEMDDLFFVVNQLRNLCNNFANGSRIN